MQTVWNDMLFLFEQTAARFGAVLRISIPRILVALLVLVLGRIVALVLEKIAALLLRLVGIDVLSKHSRVGHILQEGRLGRKPSQLLGVLVYWTVMLGALSVSFDVMEFESAQLLLQRVLIFIPQLLAAILLISLGWYLADFIGRLAEDTARASGIPAPYMVHALGRLGIGGLVALVILEKLQLSNTTLLILLTALLLPVACGLTVAVYLVSSRYLSSLLAFHRLKNQLNPGQHIQMESGIEGTIDTIGTEYISVQGEKHLHLVPNEKMKEQILATHSPKSPACNTQEDSAESRGGEDEE